MKKYAVLTAMIFTGLSAVAVSEKEWERYVENVKDIPGLVRFYSFTTDDVKQPNRVDGSADMKFTGEDNKKAALVEGHIAGLGAVVLDASSFRAPVLRETGNKFTVSIWVKPLGVGGKKGNGKRNGMICSSGSGYYDGWRLAVYDTENFIPVFQIGRAENAVSLHSSLPLNRGCWNHLAASRDGNKMNIYVNGMSGGFREFSGAAQPAKSSFAVGYAGFGVGSLKMAVDELAVFNEVLFPDRITALSLVRTSLPEEAARAVHAAQILLMNQDKTEAEKEFRKIASGDFSEPVKLWAETAAVILRSQTGRTDVNALCSLYCHPELPSHLQGVLTGKILVACRFDSPGIPSGLLERLPVDADLSDEDKFICAVALARRYNDENMTDQAVKVFEHLISLSENDCDRLRKLRLQYAQILRENNKFEEALKQYTIIVNNTAQPSYARSIAALAVVQNFMDMGQYDDALNACDTICSYSTVLPHHKYEAREMKKVCERVKAGLTKRDPEDYRNRPAPLPASSVVFYVSPGGSDENPGTFKKPFATLERARNEIREIKNSGDGLPQGGVTVYLRGGVYRMQEPLVLTKKDSGRFDAPVIYSAWKDEKPVFDGGFEVKRFRKVRDEALLKRLPEAARGRVFYADLKSQGFSDFEKQKGYGFGINNQRIRSVYEDDQFLEAARWPNENRISVAEITENKESEFTVECNRISRWSDAKDMMADGFWRYLWADEALHVESVDPQKQTITLAAKPARGLKEGCPFYVMNLFEEIDRPGEWYFDRKKGVLYIWLKKHRWFTDVVISEYKDYFIKAEGVQDLVIRGIAFQYGQDRAVLFENCVNLSIIGCRFHGFGGTAMTVKNAANANIYGNKIDTLGHGGMWISGGNRKNLTSGGITIENNEVAYFGLCSRTYVPAIRLEGVGAEVRHNRFHHAPSSAMRIEGNDHLIEYNITEFVVTESDDQGGIDMWSNASYRGCVMRYNIWRDIGAGNVSCGQAGIRFDDAISGMVVYGNIFERSSNGHFGGVQIHGGHMNIIDNNVFIDCGHAVSFSPWDIDKFRLYINETIKDKLFEEVNIDLPPYSNRYPSLKALKDKSRHNMNYVSRSIVTGTDTPWRRPPDGTVFCDNYFTGNGSPDSSLIYNSRLRAIPYSEIGLYEDPACAW
ncbi:MAG: LamG-like jellyroll fold domain-containing protein [Kiritimatiellia bacterium]